MAPVFACLILIELSTIFLRQTLPVSIELHVCLVISNWTSRDIFKIMINVATKCPLNCMSNNS